MTADFLLEAIGQIDDDLILDAEKPCKRTSPILRFTGMAAALVLCAGLSIPIFFWQANSEASLGTAPGAAEVESPTYTGVADSANTESEATTSAKPGAVSPSASPALPSSGPSTKGFRVMITLDGLTYAYSHTYPSTESRGTMVTALPDGCRAAGHVEPLRGSITVPHTDIGVYTGCALWLEGTDRDSTLYLELPEGGYLVCEYSQTYDFSPGGRG